MEKSEYLKMLRWPEAEWDLLTAEEAVPFLTLDGHTNNMYAVGDPQGKKAFGSGAFVVKKEWIAKNLTPVTKTEVVVPPPPVEEVIVPALSEFLKARIANLIKIGWEQMDNSDMLVNTPVDGELLTYTQIDDMDNPTWFSKFTPKPNPVSEVVEVIKEVVKKVEEAPVEITIDAPTMSRVKRLLALDPSYRLTDDQEEVVFGINKSVKVSVVKVMPDSVFENLLQKYLPTTVETGNSIAERIKDSAAKVEAKEKIAKIAKASGIPDANIVIASPKPLPYIDPKRQNVFDYRKSVLEEWGYTHVPEKNHISFGGVAIDDKELSELNVPDWEVLQKRWEPKAEPVPASIPVVDAEEVEPIPSEVIQEQAQNESDAKKEEQAQQALREFRIEELARHGFVYHEENDLFEHEADQDFKPNCIEVEGEAAWERVVADAKQINDAHNLALEEEKYRELQKDNLLDEKVIDGTDLLEKKEASISDGVTTSVIVEGHIDELISPLPNKERMLEQFEVLDQVMNAAKTFKEVYYAVHLIKLTLDTDETPSKKIAAIKRAVRKL